MVWDIIILTIGILAIIEGVFISLFHTKTKKIFKQLSKSKNLRKIALIEIFIGFLLILTSSFLPI